MNLLGNGPYLGSPGLSSDNLDEENQQEQKTKCPAVFFFGAGASKPAGVPTTREFVDEFENSINTESKRKIFRKIIKGLDKYVKKGEVNNIVDVELVLETIIRLENSEEDALSAFFDKINVNLKQIKRTKLSEDLKNFIKYKGKVDKSNVNYLNPLLDLITLYNTIEIISTNYDIVIEQFCNVHKLHIEDGFNGTFDKNRLKTGAAQVKLYKIHGSILWYRSTSGKFYKTTTDSNEKIKTVFGEDLEPLILYPIRKWEYVEPLFELISEAKNVMLNRDSRFIIVIGYSFRDDHIRDMFFDIFRHRTDIYCVLIDPNAYEIYEKKIKYYNYENKILTSMAGRVICIPSVIDNELESIYSITIDPIIQIIKAMDEQRKRSAEGYKAQNDDIILSLARLNYISKLEDYLEVTSLPLLLLGFWQKIEIALIIIANKILSHSKWQLYGNMIYLTDTIEAMFIYGLDLKNIEDKYVVGFSKTVDNRFVDNIHQWGLDKAEDGFGPIWGDVCERYMILERDNKKDSWRYKLTVELNEFDMNLGRAFKVITGKNISGFPARKPEDIFKSIMSISNFEMEIKASDDIVEQLRIAIRTCYEDIMGDFIRNVGRILGIRDDRKYLYGKYFLHGRMASGVVRLKKK